MKKNLPAFISFLLFITLFEILVRLEVLNSSLFPAPSQIFLTLKEMAPDFAQAFFDTFANVCVGFVLSIFFGLSVALIFSLSALLRRAILPFAIFFQTVPIIAVAPLLVIYFGFGAPTVIASAFIVSVFPIIANTLIGLESPSEAQRDLFRIYQASPLETLWHLQLPNAYIYIYTGLKISAGLSIIGAIAGEFVAGGGLGAMIDSARTQQRVDIVFGALLLLSFMGIFIVTCLRLAHKFILQQRPFASATQE